MKKKNLLVIVSLLLLLFISSCVTNNIQLQKYPKPTLRTKKREPLIRLLLFEGKKIYHISTGSTRVYVETLNNSSETNFKTEKNPIIGKEIDIKIKANLAVIQNRRYSLPIRIAGLANFYLYGIRLSGNLIVYNDLIVLEIPLEHYIEGVVASEVGVNWPLQALKAQAVVSRTYAVYSILHNHDKPYDLGRSELHQKYDFKDNIDQVKKAVRETKGIIVLYGNEPIQAFYHACSGGITESGGNVFLKDLPYLKSIRDPYSQRCANQFWEVNLTSKYIKERLNTRITKDLKEKRLSSIRIGKRTSSGRVKFFTIISDNEKFNIKGNDFRLAMNPKKFKSLLITRIIRKYDGNDTNYTFIGKGYGHGVGMSQWGAKNMAIQGFSYNNIIKFYYRGVHLSSYNKFPIFNR